MNPRSNSSNRHPAWVGFCLSLLAGLAWLPLDVHAEGEEVPYLFGSWGGTRDAWSARGVDVEALITTDVLGVVDGGLDEGFEAPSNLDLTMSIDTGTAGWWQNGTFNVWFLGNIGGDLVPRAGDLQGVSNIEGPDTFKLYEAWYEHRFMDDRLALLVGLRDLNAEFYVTEHGALFLNGSPGLGPEAALAGFSTFPWTALGARLRVEPTDGAYVQFAAFDGVPGDPDDPYGTQVQFDAGDGVYFIGEAGLHGRASRFWKLALGG